jgi:hypothetical protein
MARRRAAAKGTVRVNFKDVESRKTPPEGDYILEVLEATSEKSQGGNDQIAFVLEVAKGEYKGTKLWFYCPLAENSLWKLHAFLSALGEDVPQDEMDIDLSELVGKQVVGVLTHETYQGRKRAKMTDFDSVENYKGEDEVDDKKSSKKGKKADKAKKADTPDLDKMDEDDLRELYLEKELGNKKKAKGLDEDELREALEEHFKGGEEEEEEEKSSKKSSKKDKGKKVEKYDRGDLDDMSEKELQKLIDKHDLEVDLDDYKKLPKKVAAVADALEAEDLLED